MAAPFKSVRREKGVVTTYTEAGAVSSPGPDHFVVESDDGSTLAYSKERFVAAFGEALLPQE